MQIKITTISIIIEFHSCTAQLFPWSNLKQYFDHKTKHGPGNGGVLNIAPDLSEPGGGKTLSDRPYRHTDSDTSYTRNNKNNGPTNTFLDQPYSTTTAKDVTKQIIKLNKKNNKININYDNFQPQDQRHHHHRHNINNGKEQGSPNTDNNFKPFLPVNQDSTVRPHYHIPNNQNINVHLTNSPSSVFSNDDENNYDSRNQDTVVITQKPIVVPSHIGSDRSQNSRISHKTVSIIPSVNIKSESYVENDYPPSLYVTSRPNYPTTQTHRVPVKIKELTSTHRPVKPTVALFRPRPEYHSLQNDKTQIFLPTLPPPAVTILPKVNIPNPSQSVPNEYDDLIRVQHQPPNDQKQKLYVETVPSLAITIKASGDKPFRITDGNTGLVDYLVPPPPPSQQPIKLQSQPIPTITSSVYGSKQKRKPYQTLKEPSVSVIDNGSGGYLNTDDDYKVINEMSKLKPPENNNNNNYKKLANNKKLQNYLNLLKQQQLQELQQQSNYDDSASVYENVKNVRQQRLPRKKLQQDKSHNPTKRNNKYHNHKMPTNGQLRNDDNENDYEYRDDKSENQNSAASYINEQVSSTNLYFYY